MKTWILLALLLAGPVQADNFFFDVGIGYKINAFSSQVHWPENGGGRNPAVNLAIGYQYDNGWEFGYSHQSNLLDGPPFNNNAEVWLDQVFVSKRFKFFSRY
jgi:hypothetical protein